MNNLVWYSQVHANTGTANFCRSQCLSLHKLKLFDSINIVPDPFVPTTLKEPVLQAMIQRQVDLKDKILVQVMWPERWYATISEHPKYFIGYNAIEGTKIPYNWVSIMNDDDVDLVITMSTPMSKLFIENGVNPNKLFALGHGVDTDKFKPLPDKDSNGTKLGYVRPYTFLYVNGWRTSIGRKDRKGPEILLDAWYKGGFWQDPDVQLYMKLNMVYEEQPRDIYADIKKHLGYDLTQWKNVIIDDVNYPEEELPKIYKNADVFVSPTKGEGFGITIAEAMSTGLPVIVPFNEYAGYMDFCYPNNVKKAIFIRIDHTEEIDSRLMGHLYSGSKWHIPSTEHLIQQMWSCYKNKEKVKKIGLDGREEIVKNWTWDSASFKLVTELKRRGIYG